MAVDAKQFAGGDKKYFTVQKAGGINTRDPRQSISDEQFSWLENIHPVGDGNFRALYSNGTALYTTSNPRTIVYFYPFNLGSTNYIAVFLDDGTAVAVNADTAAVTTISSAAGTFYPGDPTLGTPLPQCAQYGNTYLVIVATSSQDAYWLWDGTLLYGPGTLAPVVTMTANGSGYATAPSVSITGGRGSGATAVASLDAGGAVASVAITNPGSGYQLGDSPTVTFGPGNAAGSGGVLVAVLAHQTGGSGASVTVHWQVAGSNQGNTVFTVSSVTVNSGGTGYSKVTKVTARGNITFGSAKLTPVIVGGVIQSVTVVNGGTYYTTNSTGDVTDTGYYFVTSVTISNGGSLYGPNTSIAVTSGGTPQSQAVITPVVVAGAISSTNIVDGGVYLSNTPPTLTVNDTASNATATVTIMPFGVGGTCVEIYQSRVWVGRGGVIVFSAAGLVSDFDPADGAGAFPSTDSFLRREFTVLKQQGSFLYLFADSSINVISNVQESGSPTLVTFNNQNVDPQIGTPWHNSVLELDGKLIFANTIGVFSLSGGHVQKVSDDLDGIFQNAYTTLLNDNAPTQPTCAVMTLHNEPVYMLVIPVKGPLDVGDNRTGLVMWNGQRWWVGSQDQVFTQVAMQELNSVIQAWGNTTTTIRKMFNTPSGTLTKLWQSKLWAGEGPHITKQATRLFTMAVDKSTGGYSFTGTYDFQLEGTAVLTQAVTVNQVNLTGVGSIAANVRGNYVGLTLHTAKDDFTLLANALLYQEQSPLGG